MKRRFQNALFDQQTGRIKNSMVIDVFKNIIEDCFHQIKLLTKQHEELQNHHFKLQDEIVCEDRQMQKLEAEMEILYGELREKSAKIDEEIPKLKRQIEIEKQNSRNTKRQNKYITNKLQKCNRKQAADCYTDLDDDRIKEYELLLDEKKEEVHDLVQVRDKTLSEGPPGRRTVRVQVLSIIRN